MHRHPTEPTFHPGDPVVLPGTGECGVVIQTWMDDELGGTDCYVAFFGKRFPSPKRAATGSPPRPYILRYAASSLRAVVTEEVGSRVRWRMPLHAAIEDDDLESARALLRGGVPQDLLNDALQRAVVRRNLPAVRLLLRHGADANAVAENGGTPLYRAVYHPKANAEVVKVLLRAGARVNEPLNVRFVAPPRRDRQRTVLHYAASVAPLAIVKLLLSRGADVNARDSKGITPLMIAAKLQRARIVHCLVRAGAVAA